MILRTPKNFQYNTLIDSLPFEYKISTNDLLEINLTTNNGYQLVNISSLNSGENNSRNNNSFINYQVENDGLVKLPIIGRVKLSGLTQKEAESMLEQKYSEYFINPFVLLKISNKKVYYFPGEPGNAQVIILKDNSTSLFELIASVGGISSFGKSRKIKLIRGGLSNPEVYLFNVYNLDDAKNTNIMLQANDIIYVEPRPYYVKGILAEVGPFLSLLSTFLLLFSLSK